MTAPISRFYAFFSQVFLSAIDPLWITVLLLLDSMLAAEAVIELTDDWSPHHSKRETND